jgi:hypothetical protein
MNRTFNYSTFTEFPTRQGIQNTVQIIYTIRFTIFALKNAENKLFEFGDI